MRKLSGLISKTNCIAIFINQIREKVGIIFGNPETTTGGRALKFYSSIRLDIRKSEQIKDGTNQVLGNKAIIKVVKNKVSPPFKSVEVDILYGIGIDKIGELIDIAVSLQIIKKSGPWYSYNDERLGQGKEQTKRCITSNLELYKKIQNEIKEK